MKGLIGHYLKLLLNESGLMSDSVQEELDEVSQIESRLDEVERGLKRLQAVPASHESLISATEWQIEAELIDNDQAPFLRIQSTDDPRDDSVYPCWSLGIVDGGDCTALYLSLSQLEHLAIVLLNKAKSYRQYRELKPGYLGDGAVSEGMDHE